MFIQRCRALDMSLLEIQTLLDLEQQPNANCSAVNQLIQQHLIELDQKIVALTALRQHLQQLNQSCQVPNTIDHCQILKILEQ
ncbi:MerR family DNA-binding protein [uncultured Acinetobacter sp.]|uniref:MerR family DNA-binding protein n=1 Tax=uncultured Acinetobacter sp. TaxID=165433 RepID=UPI00260C15AC|nr:MerR family DNA-binding protein [uncultured Acinetobacter sp.]